MQKLDTRSQFRNRSQQGGISSPKWAGTALSHTSLFEGFIGDCHKFPNFFRIITSMFLGNKYIFTALFLSILILSNISQSRASIANCNEYATSMIANESIILGGNSGDGERHYQILLIYDTYGTHISSKYYNYPSLATKHELFIEDNIIFAFPLSKNGYSAISNRVAILNLTRGGDIIWETNIHRPTECNLALDRILYLEEEYYAIITWECMVDNTSLIAKISSTGEYVKERGFNEIISANIHEGYLYIMSRKEEHNIGYHDQHTIEKVDRQLNVIDSFSLDGNEGGLRIYSGARSDTNGPLSIDDNNNIYCVIRYDEFYNEPSYQFQFLKIDSEMSIIWEINEVGNFNINRDGNVYIDETGDVIILFENDNIVYKYSSDGQLHWNKSIAPAEYYDYSFRWSELLISQDSRYYITGLLYIGTSARIYIIEFDENGEIVWYDFGEEDIFDVSKPVARLDEHGNIVIGATNISIDYTHVDAIIYKFSPDGEEIFKIVNDNEEECDPFQDMYEEDESDDSDACGCS